MDHRPLPPDLWRRDRHHVFRDRLRYLAASDRTRAGQLWPDAGPAVDLVCRHDRADLPVALGRHSRDAAPDGVLRLRRPADRPASHMGDDVRYRRRDPRAVRRALSGGAGARTDGIADGASGVPVQRRRAPATRVASRAERVRAVARPDGGADHRELRLSDRAFPGNAWNGGSGRQSRGAVTSRGMMAFLRNPWVTAGVGIT